MTTNSWYEAVAADAPITQGDLLENFPLVGWKSDAIQVAQDKNLGELLRGATEIVQANALVMTQACDLEHEKVTNVILCPFESLAEHFSLWKDAMLAGNQTPGKKAWRRYCDDIRDGFVWSMTILAAGESGDLSTPHLVVDFREIFTLPRTFIESLVSQRTTPRLRLLPPYREHLSQAFARFFMRVGLPVPIDADWLEVYS